MSSTTQRRRCAFSQDCEAGAIFAFEQSGMSVPICRPCGHDLLESNPELSLSELTVLEPHERFEQK
ncbi:hypothetical protein [Natronorubrum daqingense]|uniref:Uncharacterized protein n=1 Tax=Natronorubrum daqingense TaxID=588898 RepID=A0A1P8RJD7_9EURY|nr:hypothetical protein [Natronorubrum daqingense]APX98712.1 hypothetical protein BB347_18570 [Natronorubrum daqingense]